MSTTKEFSAIRKGHCPMSAYSLSQHRQLLPIDGSPPVIVLPICNNPLVRIGLQQLLSDTQFNVWQDPVDNPADLPGVPEEAPILFIVDGNSQPDGAADLVRHLKSHFPAGRVVILADHFDTSDVAAAWDAGADGFCLSAITHDVLVRTLELVMLGEAFLPSTVALSILDDVAHQSQRRSQGGLWGISESDLKSKKLSTREAEILICLKDGASNKVIARMLNLSDATVKVHVKTILRKVGVSNRTQAALWAAQHMSTDGGACEIATA
jgi:two-component system nitrate/nitrite response regulator NarL